MNVQRFLLASCLASSTTVLHAGRPLTTDDAGTVAPGDFEVEGGALWHRDSALDDAEFPFGLTAGVLPTLEVGLGFGSAIQERQEAAGSGFISGVGDLALGFKWNPFSEDACWAGQALAFTVKFPTASENKGIGTGETDYDLTYIASKSLGEQWAVHLNVGYTWTGDPSGAPEDDILHAGVAIGWAITERTELLGELFADIPKWHSDLTSIQCNFGARWTIHPALILDAALGTKLRGEAPDLTATMGLTWTLSARSTKD